MFEVRAMQWHRHAVVNRRVKAFASVTIIVQDNTVLPVSVTCHRSHRPAMLSTPPSAALMN
jgi:hypothetical protein